MNLHQHPRSSDSLRKPVQFKFCESCQPVGKSEGKLIITKVRIY